MDINEIYKILDANRHLNFVQRIFSPENYPRLARPDLDNNAYSTHLMSYADTESGSIVYPEIIQDKEGKLIRLQPNDAMNYAVKNKQFIHFDDPSKAASFSTDYKKYRSMVDQMNKMDKSLGVE